MREERRGSYIRVNVYAEEMTDRVEIVEKIINGQKFTGLRIYLYLPITIRDVPFTGTSLKGPFLHKAVVEGKGESIDDDSSAVTFWGKNDLRDVLWKAIDVLNKHYSESGILGKVI